MRHHLIQKDDLLQQEQEYDLHYLFVPEYINIELFIFNILFHLHHQIEQEILF
jgi:hypothetical protein